MVFSDWRLRKGNLFTNGPRFLRCINNKIVLLEKFVAMEGKENDLKKSARKLTEDIQNMGNYKNLYNEIQVV